MSLEKLNEILAAQSAAIAAVADTVAKLQSSTQAPAQLAATTAAPAASSAAPAGASDDVLTEIAALREAVRLSASTIHPSGAESSEAFSTLLEKMQPDEVQAYLESPAYKGRKTPASKAPEDTAVAPEGAGGGDTPGAITIDSKLANIQNGVFSRDDYNAIASLLEL